jgi:hypothetical protein
MQSGVSTFSKSSYFVSWSYVVVNTQLYGTEFFFEKLIVEHIVNKLLDIYGMRKSIKCPLLVYFMSRLNSLLLSCKIDFHCNFAKAVSNNTYWLVLLLEPG